jgi:hypothetical protein
MPMTIFVLAVFRGSDSTFAVKMAKRMLARKVELSARRLPAREGFSYLCWHKKNQKYWFFRQERIYIKSQTDRRLRNPLQGQFKFTATYTSYLSVTGSTFAARDVVLSVHDRGIRTTDIKDAANNRICVGERPTARHIQRR